ncbi:MAG: hypothetical protein WD114_05055 [Phycisphaerales bacterium]
MLAGVMTSIASAWVPSLFGRIEYSSAPSEEQWAIKDLNPPVYLEGLIPEFHVAYPCWPDDRHKPWQLWLEPGISFTQYEFGEEYTEWDRQLHGDIPPGFAILRGSFGFPFRCAYYEAKYYVANGGGPFTTEFFERCIDRAGFRYGIPLPKTNNQWDWVERRLPIVPHWGGMTLNTLIYGGTLALMVVLPASMQRFSRLRGGRCLACGYDLEGIDQCPECGLEAS